MKAHLLSLAFSIKKTRERGGVKKNEQTLHSIVNVKFTVCYIPFFDFIPVIRVKRNICETWRVESAELKHRAYIGTTSQTLRVKSALIKPSF